MQMPLLGAADTEHLPAGSGSERRCVNGEENNCDLGDPNRGNRSRGFYSAQGNGAMNDFCR